MEQSITEFNDFNNVPVFIPYEWTLTTRSFLDGSIDFMIRKIKHSIPSSEPFRGNGYSPTDEELEQKRLEYRERAARYAKKQVHYSIRQINADHMITLTTRDPITDRAEFFEVFTRFIRLVRNKVLFENHLLSSPRREFNYVAVPELQERGAFHMHMAVHGKQDIKFLNACWYVALGGSPTDKGDNTKGAVNVVYFKRRFSGYRSEIKTTRLVSYLTKYVTKDFFNDDNLGQHRYSRSRGIPKPYESKQFLQSCAQIGKGFVDAIIEVNEILKFITGKNPCDFSIWNRKDEILIMRGYE